MKLAVISFTSRGREIAEKLKLHLKHRVDNFDKHSYGGQLKEHIGELFRLYEAIVFISATGIAVRYIAPHLEDKSRDPAVVVVDDMGRYSISLLSGHIGGANALSIEIAETIGAQPVITTASDGRGIDSVDEFAKRYNLCIESMSDAKRITAMMVEGSTISFSAPEAYALQYSSISDVEPEGVLAVDYRTDMKFDLPHCILRPKVIYLGIGCRRGKSVDELYSFVCDMLKEKKISKNSIAALGSIAIKHDEQGLIELAEKLGCEFRLFSKEELNTVEVEQNEFVMANVGTNSVSEASAMVMGDEIIMKKVVRDGMTLAISRRNKDV